MFVCVCVRAQRRTHAVEDGARSILLIMGITIYTFGAIPCGAQHSSAAHTCTTYPCKYPRRTTYTQTRATCCRMLCSSHSRGRKTPEAPVVVATITTTTDGGGAGSGVFAVVPFLLLFETRMFSVTSTTTPQQLALNTHLHTHLHTCISIVSSAASVRTESIRHSSTVPTLTINRVCELLVGGWVSAVGQQGGAEDGSDMYPLSA